MPLQFEKISESFIKPSSPTPPQLRCYKLSLLDQMVPCVYTPMALFYPSASIQGREIISQTLQNSLSKTLSYYYPFAGRLMNNTYIDCNDKGVEFIEARIHCRMSDIIEDKSSQLKNLILPSKSQILTNHDNFNVAAADYSLVLVQLNYLDCGSLALCVSISHKLADASARSIFVNDWAAIARKSSSDDHFPSPSSPDSPQFIGTSIFPPVLEDPGFDGQVLPSNQSCVTRRFLFQASKIAELKAMAANSAGSVVDNPTRVEAVTALLYKCAMSAAKANSGSFRPSYLATAVNLRPLITIPPLPRNSVGNFVSAFRTSVAKEDEIKFPELVTKIRNGMRKLQNESKDSHRVYEALSAGFASMKHVAGRDSTAGSQNLDVYICTSWCRIPFYDVDFGWGRPFLVCYAAELGAKNTFLLIDLHNRDGNGIQAVVTLDKQEMCLFEANEELLAFASLNDKMENYLAHDI